MSTSDPQPRNPGPNWGFAFLLWAERTWPAWFFRSVLKLGTWVALPFMPVQRRHSREFLAVVLGRPARLIEVWRHFFSFMELLMLRLRIARGVPHRCRLDPDSPGDFDALIASGQPALFGTFHFGRSDMLGFHLSDTGRTVSMIRMRLGNSHDTRMLGRLFGHAVSFIWVNEPENLLFAIKDAVEEGRSLAMQCDRLEFTSKTERFDFLGARRLFPFTIYHLAVMFRRPVMFCFGVPAGPAETSVQASPLFVPDATLRREENLARARAHFQAVLARLEALVRQHPMLWFNFLPLNPATPDANATAQTNPAVQ